jgi:hypothetical protein
VPRRVSRPGTEHARLEHPSDPVAVEEQRQTGDMILVRMGQDDGVDASVPRRDAPVELDEQPVRVRPAIDQETPAAAPLDEDGVSLPDIEHRDPGDAGWSGQRDPSRDRHGPDQDQGAEAREASTAAALG